MDSSTSDLVTSNNCESHEYLHCYIFIYIPTITKWCVSFFNRSSCGNGGLFPKFSTPIYENQDNITFGDTIGVVPNPFSFNFTKWVPSFTYKCDFQIILTIEIHHYCMLFV